jgi:hypothetical protein
LQALAAIDNDAPVDVGDEAIAPTTAAPSPAAGPERPLNCEILPPAKKREPGKAKSRGWMERRGRPSKRAQALVREQLKHGPKPESAVMAAAHFADIPERSLIAAADAIGVRTRKGQWWLPGV